MSVASKLNRGVSPREFSPWRFSLSCFSNSSKSDIISFLIGPDKENAVRVSEMKRPPVAATVKSEPTEPNYIRSALQNKTPGQTFKIIKTKKKKVVFESL